MIARKLMVIALVFLVAGGCSKQVGPDSNTEVFQTAEQAAAARKEKLLVDWQEMAARIAVGSPQDERPLHRGGEPLEARADRYPLGHSVGHVAHLDQVPCCHECRYESCSAVSVSISTPIACSLSRATSLSMSTGTGYTCGPSSA